MSSLKDRSAARKGPACKADARKTRRAGAPPDHRALLNSLAEHDGPPRRPVRQRTEPVRPLNAAQARYDAALASRKVIFGIGPAGTGKTFLAATRAAEALRDGAIERIIVTRPNIEVGAGMGFLPGELEEKYEPFFRPVREALEKTLGAGAVEYHIKNGTIEARPLAYMRGATFEDACVIFDEAQNATKKEMEMFLTRLGENVTAIIDGDPRQQDIPGESGLLDAVKRLGAHPEVAVVEFTIDDVVRSGFVGDVIRAYAKP